MALKKVIAVDRIEVMENGTVQVRTKTSIFEDENQISSSYHRHAVLPGDKYSTEDARVQAVCAATHTKEVIDAYKAAMSGKGV